MPARQALNVLGTPLAPCSLPGGPVSGFYRDGFCNTDADLDKGKHTVAGIVSKQFLEFSKSRGNDLSTPRPNFPGLKDGDRWCLCSDRWLESYHARAQEGEGVVPKVVLSATHENALRDIPLDIFRRYAVDDNAVEVGVVAIPRAVPPCRFARNYKTASILSNPDRFASDLLYWEGKFHADNVSYNAATGLSYDGTLLDPTTGLHTAGHPFSAASKESGQIMIYAQALNGNKDAARFLSPQNPSKAKTIAFDIMKTKLQTYLKFNQTYPGFGGFLPWFLQTVNGSSTTVTPTLDWVNRVPALDNGENIWAIYAAVEALSSGNAQYKQLAKGWQAYLDYLKVNAAKVFYRGNGTVCAVTTLNQSLALNDPMQSYKCESNATLNDPYEGELFAWWLYFFGGLSGTEKEAIWTIKRPQLVRIDYQAQGYPPITVQKGFWFSSHENWKFMEMPYLDVPLIKRIYMNNERARTCNSVVNKNPGMFASINNSTDSSGQIIGYISNCGIPSIANQTLQELDVITPYSVFPLMLVNKKLGLAWWHNIVSGKKMQNPYGSTESTRIDGTAISSFVSWDSKITTVNALLGGVQSIVSRKMKADGIYDAFIKRITSEYEMKFSGKLSGENVSICLPTTSVPDTGLQDYTMCQ